MEIHLPPDMQDYLEGKLSSGEYASATDVLTEGLHLLRDRDSLYQTKLEELRKEIAIGVEQVRRGECSQVGPDLSAEIEARGAKRLAEEQRARVR